MNSESGHSLELAVALSRVGGDRELLTEIAELFLTDFPHSLEELHAAVEGGDARKLEHAAHGLKGSVANFGARDAVAAALELESMGRAGKFADAAAALARLETALTILGHELQTL